MLRNLIALLYRLERARARKRALESAKAIRVVRECGCKLAPGGAVEKCADHA